MRERERERERWGGGLSVLLIYRPIYRYIHTAWKCLIKLFANAQVSQHYTFDLKF